MRVGDRVTALFTPGRHRSVEVVGDHLEIDADVAILGAGAGGCVDLEVVNLTDTDITGWQMVVHLDAPAVLTSASGDGLRAFVGDTTSELDLYPTASTNKLKAFDSALGQVCLSPSAVPDHITTSWEIGP